MNIKKVKTKDTIKYEVSGYTNGRGSKRLRRRFDKRDDAEAFIKGHHAQELSFKRSATGSPALLEETRFKDEAEFWLLANADRFSPNHVKRAKGILARLLPQYGNLTLDKFSPALMTKMQLEAKKRGLANASVNRICEIVLAVLNHSLRQRRIPWNPAIGIQKLPPAREELQFWEKSEAISFLNSMSEKHPIASSRRWIYVVYLLALNTGLRAGEIWGLQVRDIVEDGESLHIRRQYDRLQKKFTLLKGKRRSQGPGLSRHVPCQPKLLAELKLLVAGKSEEETIFALNGLPIHHDSFQDWFRADLKSWGGKVIRFHDLRHTAATQLIAAGVDIKTVQVILGHEDIKTTMNYVHLVGDKVKEVARTFSLSP